MKTVNRISSVINILIIIWGLIVMSNYIQSCKKQEMYESPPEPNVYWDKSIKSKGTWKVGETVTLWLSMPPEFDFNKRWHFSQYTQSTHFFGGDTVTFKLKYKGEISIIVDGFNIDDTQILHSYLLKKIVR